MLCGFTVKQDLSGGVDYVIVLGLDDVLKQYCTGTAVALNIGIKREVQGYHLDTCIGLAGIIEGVA